MQYLHVFLMITGFASCLLLEFMYCEHSGGGVVCEHSGGGVVCEHSGGGVVCMSVHLITCY